MWPWWHVEEHPSVDSWGRNDFHREAISQCILGTTKIKTVFSVHMRYNNEILPYKIQECYGAFPGLLVAADTEYRQPGIWPGSQSHPGSYLCVVCKFVEILLWRYHIFLVIWFSHMWTLKERERTTLIFLYCLYSLTFSSSPRVCLTHLGMPSSDIKTPRVVWRKWPKGLT